MSHRFHRQKAFISLPDNQERLSHTDIKKGMESSDLKVKEKNLRLLVTYILNSENFPQMVIEVINFILPYQAKSREIKKLLFLYWEIVEKFKPDGTLKEEITLVCNNFRNDLIHPNEYIAGRALRLVANIQSKFVLEQLLDSIITKCLTHTDVYVRRHAVACLAKIQEYYGTDFLPDIVDTLQDKLEKESDLTTKRNIFLLFFRIDREKAINFVLEKIKEEEHESFGDILQLIVVKSVQEAMLNDRKLTGICIKIIKEFSSSKFNSVLYEVATSLIRYNRNPESLRQAVSILIQILKNNNDNNVKLLILDQLDLVRKRDKLALTESFVDLVSMIFAGDLDIKHEFLPFLETYTKVENINMIQKILLDELKYVLHTTGVDKDYQQRIVLLINRLVTTNIIPTKSICSHVLPIYLSASVYDNTAYDIVRVSIYSMYIHVLDKHTYVHTLYTNLLSIHDIKMYMLCIHVIGMYIDSDIQEVIDTILTYIGPMPITVKEAEETIKQPEVREKKFVTKTIVKEDGTYGEVTEEVANEYNEDTRAKETYKLRDLCIASEELCLATGRALVRLLALSRVVIVVCEFIKIHQSKTVVFFHPGACRPKRHGPADSSCEDAGEQKTHQK